MQHQRNINPANKLSSRLFPRFICHWWMTFSDTNITTMNVAKKEDGGDEERFSFTTWMIKASRCGKKSLLCLNVRCLSFLPRIGNRSWFWWASTACKVYYHRHCMSSSDNVFAARWNHPTHGPNHWWYGWVIITTWL